MVVPLRGWSESEQNWHRCLMRDPASRQICHPFAPFLQNHRNSGTWRAPRAKFFIVEGDGEAVWKLEVPGRGSTLVGGLGEGNTALATCSKGNSARNRVGLAVQLGRQTRNPNSCISCMLHHHHVIHPSINRSSSVFPRFVGTCNAYLLYARRVYFY
jgi:hypothetical protein